MAQGADGNVGAYIEAGLPNITGFFGADTIGLAHGSGYGKAIKITTSGGTYNLQSGASYNALNGYQLDASWDSDIYGKSNTVQPPAVAVSYLIKY